MTDFLMTLRILNLQLVGTVVPGLAHQRLLQADLRVHPRQTRPRVRHAVAEEAESTPAAEETEGAPAAQEATVPADRARGATSVGTPAEDQATAAADEARGDCS